MVHRYLVATVPSTNLIIPLFQNRLQTQEPLLIFAIPSLKLSLNFKTLNHIKGLFE